MAGWYIRSGEKVVGPATNDKLKQLVAAGRLLPTDELAKEPAGPWTRADRTNLFVKPTTSADVASTARIEDTDAASFAFEARQDCGAFFFKILILLCGVFAFFMDAIALAALLNPRPGVNGHPPDRSRIVPILASANVALIVAIAMFLWSKRRQRTSPPLVRISNNGIQFGPNLASSITWKQVGGLSDRIERTQHAVTTAKLNVQLLDGSAVAIDIKRLNHKPEKIVAWATEAYRNFRGVNIRDMKDFGEKINCPRCGKPTDSLKCFQSGIMVFLLFHVSYSLNDHVCCRSCTRQRLAIDSAVNLITCNIAWPLLWFGAVIIPQTGKLLFSGHDKKALEKIA
jgi:hypothetical protein